MNLERLSVLIEWYIYINFGLLALSILSGIVWTCRFYLPRIKRRKTAWLESTIEDHETRLCLIGDDITQMKRELNREKIISDSHNIKMVRIVHDGKNKKFQSKRPIIDTVTDVSCNDHDFQNLSAEKSEVYLWALTNGFTGIKQIMVFYNTPFTPGSVLFWSHQDTFNYA
jgi:hypothetical protein